MRRRAPGHLAGMPENRFWKNILRTPGFVRVADLLSSQHARAPHPYRWLRRPQHSLAGSQAAFRSRLGARGQAGPQRSVSGTAEPSTVHSKTRRPTASNRACRPRRQDRPEGDCRGAEASAIRLIGRPARSDSFRQRSINRNSALASGSSFFNGWRSTPGTAPLTSQFALLISKTQTQCWISAV
jgi:hypothetical protein